MAVCVFTVPGFTQPPQPLAEPGPERDLKIDAILVTVLETATATVEYVIITAARGWPVRVGRGIVHGYAQVVALNACTD